MLLVLSFRVSCVRRLLPYHWQCLRLPGHFIQLSFKKTEKNSNTVSPFQKWQVGISYSRWHVQRTLFTLPSRHRFYRTTRESGASRRAAEDSKVGSTSEKANSTEQDIEGLCCSLPEGNISAGATGCRLWVKRAVTQSIVRMLLVAKR